MSGLLLGSVVLPDPAVELMPTENVGFAGERDPERIVGLRPAVRDIEDPKSDSLLALFAGDRRIDRSASFLTGTLLGAEVLVLSRGVRLDLL